nr:MAG TPA: hypothetical protein [Caudoviricetes sp.]
MTYSHFSNGIRLKADFSITLVAILILVENRSRSHEESL